MGFDRTTDRDTVLEKYAKCFIDSEKINSLGLRRIET